ncbi:hypothetical protein GCM10009801_45830 [Streptomyces albiaxialis]|uniref:Uncharacterized protein n=1 Tax=Streptomyces albiaxialis TaxID=329523 RepID=A0ABP5HSD1_9ACTN
MTVLQEQSSPADARELINTEEFAAVTATVSRANPDMKQETAERIVADALAFTAAGAVYPMARLRPSRIVDEGWHALILNTRVYERLCTRLGRFVHHVPEPGDPSRHDASELARTQAMIRQAGYTTHADLWRPPTDRTILVAANCEHSPPPPEGACEAGDCSNTGPN